MALALYGNNNHQGERRLSKGVCARLVSGWAILSSVCFSRRGRNDPLWFHREQKGRQGGFAQPLEAEAEGDLSASSRGVSKRDGLCHCRAAAGAVTELLRAAGRTFVPGRKFNFKTAVTFLLIFPIRIYQVCLSPLLPAHCRYYPTCSEYAIQAIRKYGPWRGLYRAVRRVLRCHPWTPGGYDPV